MIRRRTAPLRPAAPALRDAFEDDMRLFHLALPKAHPAARRAIERGDGPARRAATRDRSQVLVGVRREEAAERRRGN